MNVMRVIWPSGQAALVGLLLALSQAAIADPLEAARECAAEPSRLERLGCYDALFQDLDEAADEVGLPPLWHAIERLEAGRDADDFSLRVDARNGDVLLSAPARGTTPPRPLLVIACEKSITRFQLHLPEALDVPRAELTMGAGGRALSQAWRVRDAGHVVSGGRGLPAIETLRQLLDADELLLASEVATLDGLRFDIGELRQRIQPLRDSCRW